MKKNMENQLIKKFTYRIANINDAESIYSIGKLSLSEAWELNSITYDLSLQDDRIYIVCEVQGSVIAFAGLWKVLNEGDITNIAVHPDYRGLGVGENTIINLFKEASLKEIDSITLEVRKTNIIAINLYKKLGFEEVGFRKNFYGKGEDGLVMRKTLSQNSTII